MICSFLLQLCLYLCTTCMQCPRRPLDALDLELRVLRATMETKPRSSRRAANALTPWAISLAYESFLWVTCKWQGFGWNPTLSGYKIHAINNSASIVLAFLSVLSISYLLKKRVGPEELEQFKQGDSAQSLYSTPAGPKTACSHGLLT